MPVATRRLTWVGVPKEARKAIRKHIREELVGTEFLICSDKAADQKARANIRESLWAFSPNFILSRSRLKLAAPETVLKAFKKMQEELCEDANEIVFALLKNFKKFCREAIDADGRGHLLSPYDGKEHEVMVPPMLGFPRNKSALTFYVYRVN